MVRRTYCRVLEPNGNAHWPGENLDSPPCQLVTKGASHPCLSLGREERRMADNEGCGELARREHHAIRRLIKDGVLAAEQVVPDAPYQIRASDLQSQKIVDALAPESSPMSCQNRKPAFDVFRYLKKRCTITPRLHRPNNHGGAEFTLARFRSPRPRASQCGHQRSTRRRATGS